MKKQIFKIFILAFLILFSPSILKAETVFPPESRDIGETCNTNADCFSGDCESSDLDVKNPDFCVCDDSVGSLDCATRYGKHQNESWTCKDGIVASHDLHYCQSNLSGNIFPIVDAEIIKVAQEKEAQEAQAKEDIIESQAGKAPFLPALGDVCKLKDVTSTPGETTQNPWIADCVKSLYHYLVVIGSVFAVLFIMIGGIMYLSAGFKSEYASQGKTIMLGSIFGIVILLSSYLILNLINPNLTNLSVISLKNVQMQELSLDITEQGELDLPSDWPVGTIVAAPPASISDSDGPKTMFTKTYINTKPADGYALWMSFTDQEKQTILPYLRKQIAVCSETPAIMTITDSTIPEWKGYQIHKGVFPAFKAAYEHAKSWGLIIKPGSIFRNTITEGIPLWNTGIVARFQQKRDKVTATKTDKLLVSDESWKTNQGKISEPTCVSPHNTGGAVDINLYDKNNHLLIGATSTTKITSANYQSEFANDENMVLLEKIMSDSGYVRFCGEHWHFEYGVTERYSRWNKTSRCWDYSNSIDQDIPDATKKKVNAITQSLVGKKIYPQVE
jgi:hypothetical protein